MSDFPARILVATDGSEDAALAIRSATDLSTRAGSELHMVHAWREPSFLGYFLEEVAEGSYVHEREEAERLLEGQVQAAGAKVLWLQSGVINEEAAKYAREHGLTVVMDRCIKVEHALLVDR